MHGCLFLCKRRESEGRRRRFRRREGDEAGGGGDDEDPVGEEDGYGAYSSHVHSEKIYQDLCRLHLPPPPSAAQVIIFIISFILSSSENRLFYFSPRCVQKHNFLNVLSRLDASISSQCQAC